MRITGRTPPGTGDCRTLGSQPRRTDRVASRRSSQARNRIGAAKGPNRTRRSGPLAPALACAVVMEATIGGAIVMTCEPPNALLGVRAGPRVALGLALRVALRLAARLARRVRGGVSLRARPRVGLRVRLRSLPADRRAGAAPAGGGSARRRSPAAQDEQRRDREGHRGPESQALKRAPPPKPDGAHTVRKTHSESSLAGSTMVKDLSDPWRSRSQVPRRDITSLAAEPDGAESERSSRRTDLGARSQAGCPPPTTAYEACAGIVMDTPGLPVGRRPGPG